MRGEPWTRRQKRAFWARASLRHRRTTRNRGGLCGEATSWTFASTRTVVAAYPIPDSSSVIWPPERAWKTWSFTPARSAMRRTCRSFRTPKTSCGSRTSVGSAMPRTSRRANRWPRQSSSVTLIAASLGVVRLLPTFRTASAPRRRRSANRVSIGRSHPARKRLHCASSGRPRRCVSEAPRCTRNCSRASVFPRVGVALARRAWLRRRLPWKRPCARCSRRCVVLRSWPRSTGLEPLRCWAGARLACRSGCRPVCA